MFILNPVSWFHFLKKSIIANNAIIEMQFLFPGKGPRYMLALDGLPSLICDLLVLIIFSKSLNFILEHHKEGSRLLPLSWTFGTSFLHPTIPSILWMEHTSGSIWDLFLFYFLFFYIFVPKHFTFCSFSMFGSQC